MTENLSKKLGDKIIQLYSNPNELGKYYFTHKNCASMILFLFDSINLKVPYKQQFLANLTNGFSPDELNSILENSLISLNPIEKILSKSNIIKSLSSYYKVKIESKIHDDTQSFMRWSDAEKYALSKMSWHELQHVASVLDETDFPRQNFVTFLLRKNPYVKGRVFKTFNFYNFPKSFYLICQNSDCADKVALDMTSVYSPDEIENLYHQISLHIKRSLNLFLPELDIKESIYTKHWSLIVSSLKKLRIKEHK